MAYSFEGSFFFETTRNLPVFSSKRTANRKVESPAKGEECRYKEVISIFHKLNTDQGRHLFQRIEDCLR